MPDFVNPYTPGQPVSIPDRFVGRRDALVSIREQLVKGRRVFVVSGARRMGKTSFLRQVPLHLPDDHLSVHVALREEHAQRFDWLLWRLAVAVSQQVGHQLGVACPEPAWSDYEGRPEHLLADFWPSIRGLLGARCLVLLLDDLHSLAQNETGLLDRLASFLAKGRDQDPNLALVITTSVSQGDALSRAYPRLLGGALSYVFGPLSSEEAIRLITWPVDGVMTYDYGLPRRLVEITSGQPYYLQLLCSEVFNRCAPAGWVNQRDVDLVMEGLVGREIAEFRQVWDESSPPDQAVLAALVSLRGARGVATMPEVHDILIKAGARVGRPQVEDALQRLTQREILERLGAHSYRFRVALLRDWLGKRLELRDVVRNARWTGKGRGQSLPPTGGQGRSLPPTGGQGHSAGERATRSASLWESMSRLLVQRERRKEPPSPTPEPVPAEETATAGPSAGPAQDTAEAVLRRSSVAVPRRGPSISASLRGLPRPWLAVIGVLGAMVLTALSLRVLKSIAGRPVETPAVGSAATVRLSSTASFALATPTMSLAATSKPVAQGAAATPRPVPTAMPTVASPTAPLIVARAVPAIAYLSKGAGDESWTLYVMDSDGSNRTPVVEASSDFLSAPSWSPDGSRIAFVSDVDGNADIWVMGSDGRNAVNLTRNKAKDQTPAWSTDGQWIAFASVRDSLYYELYVMRPDAADVQRLTWWGDASDLSPSWSPDGKRVAFASKRDGNWEIYAMDRDGSNLMRLTGNPGDDRSPAWSPDGSRIAFESTRDRYADVYVMPATGGEAVNLTNLGWSTDLGPTWSPDGGRIAFFSDRDGEWDIYVMNSDGSNVVKLTDDRANDQLPAWRP